MKLVLNVILSDATVNKTSLGFSFGFYAQCLGINVDIGYKFRMTDV